MKNIKVVFMGTPEFAVPILKSLIDVYDVIGVVTQPDKEVGRNKVLTPSPIKKEALNNGIKVFQPRRIRKEYEDIINLKPDIIITCAYGQIIPSIILNLPRLGCINVHASLLPELRGGAPLQRAIMNGYKETGITIMYMDEKMDTGDIISQEKIAITNEMTLGDLHDKLSILGRDLLMKTLPDIINETNTRIKQDDTIATYANLIKPEDEIIDFNNKAIDIYNKIRGLNPFPGAYTIKNGKRIKIYKAYIEKENGNNDILIKKDGISIPTLDDRIVITEMQIEGKKRMPVKEYLNGTTLKKIFTEE